MIRNLLSFFQTILGYKQASSDGIDSDTIAFCKEDRSIHTHDTDFYCGSQKLGTAAYQSTDAFSAAGHTHQYLPLSGGTMTDTINSSVKTNTHLAGNKGRVIINSLASAGSYVMLAKMNSTNGFFMHGTFGTDYKLQYTAASVVSEGKNYVSHTAKLLDEDGNTSFPGTVTAPTFSGKLNGNANTASKWAKARTITIGNTGKSVNGSSNVSWSLSEIGAAPANHTHEYLPISGGIVRGDINIDGTLYVDNIKGYSENSSHITLGTGDNSGYVYITDDMFGKNEDGGESWSINANSGYATFSGVSQTSDQRLKENIQDVSTEFSEKYWDTENGLIHEYDWKKSGKHATGMIAQELLNYIPEAVNYNVEADSYSVDYTSATCKIIGAMFKKIKELEETIHALEER